MTTTYQLRRVDDAKYPDIISCDSCGSEAPTGEFDQPPMSAWPIDERRPKRLLCRFCAETMAGNYTQYPSPDPFERLRAEMWKAAACVFNMLANPPPES
jgi:hypothetical protein